MRSSVHPALFFSFALAVTGLTSASAQVTITLDNPDQVVAAPVSGSTILNFTGTVSIAPGYFWNSSNLDYAFNSTSSERIITTFGIGATPAENSGSVSGILFTAEIPSTALSDYYGYHGFTLNPSLFEITALNPIGSPFTESAPFSITITPAAASTPEPGGMALLAGLGISATGFLVRRRKPRKTVR